MYNNEIVAKVKFNEGYAYVFKNPIELKYYRFGNTIIGTDGIFYTCLGRDIRNGGNSFAGRKITWVMADGEVVVNDGHWWDTVTPDAAILMPKSLTRVTYNDVEDLRKCYVYYGAIADVDALNEILRNNPPIDTYNVYHDFKHVLKAVQLPKFKSRFGTWMWGMPDTFWGVDNFTYRKHTVNGKTYFSQGGMLNDDASHRNYSDYKDTHVKPEYLIKF